MIEIIQCNEYRA